MRVIHICEVCGKTEYLDVEEAFRQGWDYPPRMGAFKVVSARTCGNCTIDKTLYWELVAKKTLIADLSEKHRATLDRILGEPENILLPDNDGLMFIMNMKRPQKG